MNTSLPKNAFFEPYLRMSIGMDDMFNHLDALTTKSTYPPHDIMKLDDSNYRIVVAVAGFTREDLEVELTDGSLVITGRDRSENPENDGYVYIHKGISSRVFTKTFRLAEGIEVKNVKLDGGLLKIDLLKKQSQNTKKLIKIN